MGSLLLASHLLSLLIAFLSLHLPSQLAAAARYNIHPYQYQLPPPSSPPPPPENLSSPPPPKKQYKWWRSLLQRRPIPKLPWPIKATRKSPPPPF
ncbi:hypothetical protein SDJN03_07404, partial [Cucurbita argyrosperma subsp. sororia]